MNSILLAALSTLLQQTTPVAPVKTSITVTADPVSPVETHDAAKVAFTHDRDRYLEQPLTTIGDLFRADPGILVQATTTAQVSPFLRGLTGYQVLNLVDGVRYNNATFRSGPNQYLALLEPSQSRAMEAVLGPSAAEFGSDALGGVIHVLTPSARFVDTREVHGSIELMGASADLSAAANAQLQVLGRRFAWLAGGAGHRLQDLRAGGATDSRHTLRRLFDLNPEQIRNITGERLQDTAFTQAGGHTKLALRPTDQSTISLWYQHSTQSGVRNYKDLWGGLGRMQSAVTPQSVDLLYARAERAELGWFDSLSGTFSLNRQRDGSIRQALRAADSVTTDDTTVDAFGYTGQARGRLGRHQSIAFGGEVYDERISATRLLNSAAQRPLYPDGSKYLTTALYLQDSAELFARRLRLTGGLRWTRVRYQTYADSFGVADSSQAFRDFTYNLAASWQATRHFGLQFVTGRGFRAPNANDLGAVGLNDLGYEVPARDAVDAGALLASSAAENATSLGHSAENLKPETLWNYEGGVRVQVGNLYLRTQAFWADLRDPIVRRTLLFPAGVAPVSLAGQPVQPIAQTPAQAAQGVVAVATPIDPRAVKSFLNDGRSRYYGVETLAEWRSSRWQFHASYSYLLGRDLNPNRNIRRLPPQQGSLRVRYQTAWRGLWLETGALAAGAQERLSGGDLDDERIGASRSRADIASFFNGTRISPYIRDGRFIPTGETLIEVQNRVLPGVSDATRVPLYRDTAGWAVFEVKAGLPVTDRLQLTGGIMNIADRNYRVHGSGVDGAGRNVFLALRWNF